MGFTEYAGKVLQRHYRVNLYTGKERKKRNLPRTSGKVVLSSNGEAVLAREDYDRRSGVYKVYFGASLDEEVIYQTKFDKSKNRTIYLSTVLDGKVLMQETEKNELTLFTIDPKTKAQAPFKLDANVPSGYEYGPMFDSISGDLIGVKYTDDISRQVFLAEPSKSWHRKTKMALKGQNISILSRKKDNSMVTLFAQSSSNP